MTHYCNLMLILPPARLEALAQFCTQEFHQFPPTQLVIVTFNPAGQLSGTVRRLQPIEQLSSEQILQAIRPTGATSALLACLTPWPLSGHERSQQCLQAVDDLLECCHAQQIELLDYLCIQGLCCRSLRTETDLWYSICG